MFLLLYWLNFPVIISSNCSMWRYWIALITSSINIFLSSCYSDKLWEYSLTWGFIILKYFLVQTPEELFLIFSSDQYDSHHQLGIGRVNSHGHIEMLYPLYSMFFKTAWFDTHDTYMIKESDLFLKQSYTSWLSF